MKCGGSAAIPAFITRRCQAVRAQARVCPVQVKPFGSSEEFLLWTEQLQEFSVAAGGWGRWKLHWQVSAWEAGCSGDGGKVSGCVGILEGHARAPCPAIAASLAPGSPVPLLCPRPCSLWGSYPPITHWAPLRWGQTPPPPFPLPGDCGM